MQSLRILAVLAVCLVSVVISTAEASAYDPVASGARMPGVFVSDQELKCLAEAVYFEARGESELGQEAVAQVVVNRTRIASYPRSICGVVYQNQHRRNACQFSFACDGKPEIMTERAAWRRAQHIATCIATGLVYVAELRTATHYHAAYVAPSWARKMKRLSRIGLHVFFHEDR